MKGKAVSAIVSILLLTSMLTLAFNIRPVKASGTIYIRADGSIDPPDAPISTVDNVTYTLTGNITSEADGIVVERSNIIIDGNGYTVQGTWSDSGIGLSYRSNVTIKNMNIKAFDSGIYIIASSNNSISGNNITANYAYGIYISSSSNYNSISGNNITANYWVGIRFGSSSNYNNISGNNVANNLLGITLGPSSSNSIFHNNFINNTQQAHSIDFINVWDNGFPSGGNYWSDYTGVDLKSGPNQDQLGSDGIGDTPYIIDDYNRDNYPLMKPYPWDPHDIGITRIASKTVVGQGFSLCINVTIFNYGISAENFNVSVYTNTTIMQTITNVALTSRNSTTLTFTWNTTGFAKGNYTISAVADIVQGETYTTDNTFIGGTVLVTLPGDVNGDRYVEGRDIALIAKCFDKSIGQPGYVPNADINNDGTIEGKDIATAAKNFDKQWT